MKNKSGLRLHISIALMCTPFFTFSQDVKNTFNIKKLMHNECMHDAYIPNSNNNKKVSPAYKYRNNIVNKKLNSSIFTTQVNITNTGQDIAGDAANEPNIAINPLNGNEMVIGWRQFDNIASNFRQAGYSYSSDGGLTWTFPGVIEPGVFRTDPVLDFDLSGKFYYNSLTSSAGIFSCKVFESINGGAGWNTGTDARGGDKQWMAIDRSNGIGSGNIYSFWTYAYSFCPPDNFTRSTTGGSFYENCTLVDGEPYWGTMAISNSGQLFIAAGSNDADSLIVIKSADVQIPGSVFSWDTIKVNMDGNLDGWLPINPVGLVGQANIDIDRSNGPGQGNIYILATMPRVSNLDPSDVMFAKSTDGGLSWSPPININDDLSTMNKQWMGTMSVAPNGRIDAVWLDNRDDPGTDNSALYYSYSTDEGNTWSVNEDLSGTFDPHIGYPNQDKMGDYFDMISDNYGAHLAWTNTFNGGEDVYYSHIIPPIPLGLNTIAAEINISILPNPSSGKFVVTSAANEYQIAVYSVFGEKVFDATSDKSKSEIDISMQRSGIYFIKINYQDGISFTRKIIKE